MKDSLVFLTGKMVVSVFARLQSSACSVNSLQKKGKNIVTSMLNNISFFMLNDTRVCVQLKVHVFIFPMIILDSTYLTEPWEWVSQRRTKTGLLVLINATSVS